MCNYHVRQLIHSNLLSHSILLGFFWSFPTFSRGGDILKLQALHLYSPVSLWKLGPKWVPHGMAFPLWGWAASWARSCSCVRRAGHCLHPTKIISSRKVCNSANEVKSSAKPDLITASIFGLLEMALRHQNARLWCWAAAFPWMGSVSVGGVGEQDVARFALGNRLGWGQLSCVCVCSWIKSLLYRFLLENREAFHVRVWRSISEWFRMSNSELLGCFLFYTWCFKHNFKNSGKSRYSGESKLNFICSTKAFFFFFLIWIWIIALSGCYSAKDRAWGLCCCCSVGMVWGCGGIEGLPLNLVQCGRPEAAVKGLEARVRG